jgi:hypothetical protein
MGAELVSIDWKLKTEKIVLKEIRLSLQPQEITLEEILSDFEKGNYGYFYHIKKPASNHKFHFYPSCATLKKYQTNNQKDKYLRIPAQQQYDAFFGDSNRYVELEVCKNCMKWDKLQKYTQQNQKESLNFYEIRRFLMKEKYNSQNPKEYLVKSSIKNTIPSDKFSHKIDGTPKSIRSETLQTDYEEILGTNETETKILKIIHSKGKVYIDELMDIIEDKSDLDMSLFNLEMQDRITLIAGNMYKLK